MDKKINYDSIDQAPREYSKLVNTDAGETLFFARELEHIKAQSYDVQYAELKAQQNIPISTEAGSAAESITYRQYDMVGIAKVIANYADDLPRADVKGKEFTSPVRALGESYGYSIQEIRASVATNKSLPQRKANAARRAIEQKINSIAWKAYPTDGENAGLTGLIYQPNVTKAVVATGATTAKVTWAEKIAAGQNGINEVLLDLNTAVTNMRTLTKGVEDPDTLLLPIAQYALLQQTPRSLAGNADTTIMDFFLKNNPQITKVEWIPELTGLTRRPSNGVAIAAIDAMILFNRNADKLTLEIPQPFEQFPVQERNLEYVVPCHARTGGVIVYYPLSVSITEGI